MSSEEFHSDRPVLDNSEIISNRYKSSSGGEAVRYELPSGQEVKLEHDSEHGFTNILWPTSLGLLNFFETGAAIINQSFTKAWIPQDGILVSKNRLAAYSEANYVREATFELVGIKGALVWLCQNVTAPQERYGGVSSRDPNSIDFPAIMTATGTNEFLEFKDRIVERIVSESLRSVT